MSGRSGRCFMVILCLLLGTFMGVYLQRFSLTSLIFRDVVNTGFDLKNVDLVFLRFGLMFGVRLNLGSLIGALAGIWISR
jgi:hypothetical protein